MVHGKARSSFATTANGNQERVALTQLETFFSGTRDDDLGTTRCAWLPTSKRLYSLPSDCSVHRLCFLH